MVSTMQYFPRGNMKRIFCIIAAMFGFEDIIEEVINPNSVIFPNLSSFLSIPRYN